MEDWKADIERLMKLMDERGKRSNVIDMEVERKKRAAVLRRVSEPLSCRPQESGFPRGDLRKEPDREDR